jgi:hypothetical protein
MIVVGGHIASGKKLPVDKAPIIISDEISTVTDQLMPVRNESLHFTMNKLKMGNPVTLVLEPFYQIHDARYMMYWMALTNMQYQSFVDSIAIAEKRKLALQKRTVDFVAPGEQQPEADHYIEQSNSNSGNRFDEFWRDARNEGYFSFKMATNNETNLNLMVRYWGAERGDRKFDIYIDDEKLLTENNTDKWNQQKFQDVEYAIPESMLKDKRYVRMKFQALPGNTAGPVFYIRLVRRVD